ncbi:MULTISPECIES: FMN-dependent NADH-azoreductase [unclassified Burkholderia]|uniref:FMN-dependent NADH-azoreductase n=1 Tax=unclassified Burkholderia TaxID=2613784 RepID=UPI0009FD2FBC|nr:MULTISPECIES: NAD(P)H-dependent oxidoreductase [unclassified Burkholderia]MBR8236096.1 NAD(P)H-dependent oxidoreductase [Burkholderia sp. AU32357]MBY4871720.1 NAD(P)H-dependent oxidoreductase [Burkholderia sp. AU42008]OXI37812.1 FMN-dependent NADH-azoreductase [Burkholderia sp. AU17457]
MKLLHLDSSIMGANSASRVLSAAIVERIVATNDAVNVTYRDLASETLPHLSFDAFMTLDAGKDVQQFLETDVVVIGAGFYNFSVPTQLKAWIDHIVVRGKTFARGESGPIGLAQGKRVIVALARGNVYSEGSPYQAFEHAETLLRSVFTFMGVQDIEFIVAEGLGRSEEVRRASIASALEKAREVSPNAAAPATPGA